MLSLLKKRRAVFSFISLAVLLCAATLCARPVAAAAASVKNEVAHAPEAGTVAANDAAAPSPENPLKAKVRVFFDNYLLPLLLLAGFLVVVAVTAANASYIKDNLLPCSAATRVALAVILAAGVGLRFFAPVAAPVHSNYNGLNEIRILLSDSHSDAAHAQPYGETFSVIMKNLMLATGKSDAGLFLLNRIFGSLCIVAIFMLARALLISEAGALLAALIYCMAPAQVWLSSTETPFCLFSVLSLAGMSFIASALRSSRTALLCAGIIMAVVAASIHLATITILPAAAVLVLLSVPSGEHPRGNRLSLYASICGVAALAFLLLHFLSLDFSTLGKGAAWFNAQQVAKSLFSQRNILFDSTLSPIVVPAMALAGWLFALRRSPRLGAGLAAAFVVIVPFSLTVLACRTDGLRYQAPAQWVSYLAAGCLFYRADDRPGLPLSAMAALALAAAALIACAAPGLSLLHKGDEEAREYVFMRDYAKSIPSDVVIRIPETNPRAGVHSDFPNYSGNHGLVSGNAPGAPGGNELIYLGLFCHRRSEKDTAAFTNGMRPECAAMCSGNLSPVKILRLDASVPASGWQARFHAITMTEPIVGFYKCGR